MRVIFKSGADLSVEVRWVRDKRDGDGVRYQEWRTHQRQQLLFLNFEEVVAVVREPDPPLAPRTPKNKEKTPERSE